MVKELTLPATVPNITAVTEFVEGELESADCPMKTQIQISVAIDEIFGNIAHYAYDPDVGDATVRLELLSDPRAVKITFIDGGKPYDPLKKADPDLSLSVDDKPIGGLGIFMVKKSMDDLSYEYKDGKNVFAITKQL